MTRNFLWCSHDSSSHRSCEQIYFGNKSRAIRAMTAHKPEVEEVGEMCCCFFEDLQSKYEDDFNWFALTDDQNAFENELTKELKSSHPLFGLTLHAVAKKGRNDDVLFFDGCDFYSIHLTWATPAAGYPHYITIPATGIAQFLEQDYLLG